jgi:hypothetical protein
MYQISLMTPIVEKQKVTFVWRVEPTTTLYSKTSFKMTFPGTVDLSRVPDRLWWDIFLICLHPHWLLLRPCQIHLPLKMSAPERQFWLQLLENGFDTLTARRPERLRLDSFGITIIAGELDIPRTSVSGFGFGTSFSSGKDSLLQAALLCELTERPLLVTTTSPLPPLADHETERRRTVLAAIQERRNVQLVEVHSDFRSIWDNGFAPQLGYSVAVNELTDTFLYMSSLLAAGAALGKTRLFLASEAEVQLNHVIDGRIVQHKHFMYSAATQRALDQLLVPYGIRFGSLTWPLYSIQVQQLLWARYPDLCDLQYSCWRVQPGEAACSQCEQCFRIAMIALAGGENPERMGIDLRKVLYHAPDYVTTTSPATSILPQDWKARVRDAVCRVSLIHLVSVLAKGRTRVLVSRETFKILWNFYRLQSLARRAPRHRRPGVREAFFDFLEPELRESLIGIYTRHFPREPRREHFAEYERSRALTLRATSFLDSGYAEPRSATTKWNGLSLDSSTSDMERGQIAASGFNQV